MRNRPVDNEGIIIGGVRLKFIRFIDDIFGPIQGNDTKELQCILTELAEGNIY